MTPELLIPLEGDMWRVTPVPIVRLPESVIQTGFSMIHFFNDETQDPPRSFSHEFSFRAILVFKIISEASTSWAKKKKIKTNVMTIPKINFLIDVHLL